MRILAIESATPWCGIALWDSGPVASRHFANHMDLSKRLAPTIQTLLAEEGWAIGELQGISVSLGPGSFTGLRIGVATAKTLAQVLQIPVAGVGTMDALAAPFVAASRPVWTCLSARRDHWYLRQGSGDITIVSTAELATALEGSPEPVVLLGDPALRGTLLPATAAVPETSHRPDALNVACLGAALLEAGNAIPVMDLVPLYVGVSAAEERRTGPAASSSKGT